MSCPSTPAGLTQAYPDSQEFGVPEDQQGIIWSCANAGLAVGALGWGLIVDMIGRKWAFNLTCLITSVFGMLLVRSAHPG